MAYKRFTKQEIDEANSISIVEYVNRLNLETKKTGNTIKIEGYGGLYINPVENKWNCFSEEKGGGPIQLVMYLEKKTWVEAIKSIQNKSYSEKIKPNRKINIQNQNKNFTLPKKNNTYNHIIAYLIKTRKIDKDIVYQFIQNKTLYEDEKRNCVFVGYDQENKPAYAGLRGTNSNIPFKGEVEASNKAYSFNLKGESNKLFIFESPIELMSYLTLKKNEGFEDKKHHMLSLACLAPVALERYLKDNSNIKEINLCLNNDKWGIKATREIRRKYEKKYNIKTRVPELKDWNDDLVYGSDALVIEAETTSIESDQEDEWDMEL